MYFEMRNCWRTFFGINSKNRKKKKKNPGLAAIVCAKNTCTLLSSEDKAPRIDSRRWLVCACNGRNNMIITFIVGLYSLKSTVPSQQLIFFKKLNKFEIFFFFSHVVSRMLWILTCCNPSRLRMIIFYNPYRHTGTLKLLYEEGHQ